MKITTQGEEAACAREAKPEDPSGYFLDTII